MHLQSCTCSTEHINLQFLQAALDWCCICSLCRQTWSVAAFLGSDLLFL